MSARIAFPPVPHDAFYTPAHAVRVLLDVARDLSLFPQGGEIWECAAGAGHIASVLRSHGHRVLATDTHPAPACVFPVALGDFLTSNGPSGHRLSIVTNPPYGQQSRLALAFLRHALNLMESRKGAIALLLPFEFDAAASRSPLVGAHPWFVGKRTVGKRIRWVNLPQSDSGPAGHHSWFLWSTEIHVQRRAKAQPLMVSA